MILTATAGGLWCLKLPLRIGQSAVKRKYRPGIPIIGHSDLKGGEFGVPFIDLDAADVFFRPGLIVHPDVAIGMEKEQRLFPTRSRLAKRNKERPEFVIRLTRSNDEWICLADDHGRSDVAHR